MPTDTRAMMFSTELGDQEEEITITSTKLEFDFQGDPRGEILKEVLQSDSSPSPAKYEIWAWGKNPPSCFSCTQGSPQTAPLNFLQTWAHFYPSATLLTEEGFPRKMQKNKQLLQLKPVSLSLEMVSI